jgi:hypothetical protein
MLPPTAPMSDMCTHPQVDIDRADDGSQHRPGCPRSTTTCRIHLSDGEAMTVVGVGTTQDGGDMSYFLRQHPHRRMREPAVHEEHLDVAASGTIVRDDDMLCARGIDQVGRGTRARTTAANPTHP